MRRVLFRVDAGSEIGLGHLNRCLSLASALRETGQDCVFLTSEEPAAQHLVEALGFVARSLADVELGGQCDWEQTRFAANACDCGMVVVDSYHVGADFLRRLRDDGLLVVAIDDVANFTFPCHLVINGGICAESLPYRSLTRDTRFLLGARYAMLRPEFWRCRPRTRGRKVGEVLITMGGSDGRNLTPVVLETLDSLECDFKVTAIIGPFFRNPAKIEEVAEHCRHTVHIAHNPVSVRDLMVETDLAISAGGQTLYELAATGTPTVAVQVAENQAANVCSFAQSGAISPIVFRDRDQLSRTLTEKAVHLLQDSKARGHMCRSGQLLVDGQGARRVARHVADTVFMS